MRRRHAGAATSILISVLPIALTILIVNVVAYEFDPRSPEVKYWPLGAKPDERTLEQIKSRKLAKRSNASPQEPLRSIKKMPADESSKFLDSYWQLLSTGAIPITNSFTSPKRSEDGGDEDMSKESQFLSPYALHMPNPYSPARLFRRQQYVCPQNYYPCTSISAPAFCCRTDQRCDRIQDTGFGNVACCPNDQTCTGGLNGCTSGEITCSSANGGGCCVAGYSCSPQGCVPDVGGNLPTPTTSYANSQTTQACSAGFYACPSSLAGGCCPIGRSCGVELCPASTGGTCPTGFYSCAPAFNGGCCRIGRNCGMTDCPVMSGSSNTSPGSGAKAAATSNAAQVVSTGLCANGWYTCPPSLNGGCCPLGYDCGVSNCPAQTLGGGGLNILPPETKSAPLPVATRSAASLRLSVWSVRWVVGLSWFVFYGI